MTRAEIEKIRAVAPYCFKTDGEKTWYEIGYNDGLKSVDVELLLKSIWHDSSEEPLLEGEEIISISEYGSTHISERFCCTFLYNLEDYYWEEFVNSLKIKKWAYISDLLPKGAKK